MLKYVYNCIWEYIAVSYMLMLLKGCIYLFAHAEARIQSFMRVYSCVFMLISMKSCIFLFAHATICMQPYMQVYNCVYMYILVCTC